MLPTVDDAPTGPEGSPDHAPASLGHRPGRRAGPDGRLIKRTVAFPADVLEQLTNADIRQIVTAYVRARTSASDNRDP